MELAETAVIATAYGSYADSSGRDIHDVPGFRQTCT
jgi:hypothetical protein